MRRSVTPRLESSGFQVVVFSEPEAFLHHLETHTAQVALVDIWVQSVAGVELMASLYAASFSTRTILITGDENQSAEIGVISAGAFDSLGKTLNDIELCDAIEEAFSEPALADETRVPTFP